MSLQFTFQKVQVGIPRLPVCRFLSLSQIRIRALLLFLAIFSGITLAVFR